MVDRLDRRWLLHIANLLRFVAFAGMAVVLVYGAVNLAVLYIIYADAGLVEATSDTAVFSVLPDNCAKGWA